MGTRAIENRVKKLQELEQQKAELEKQIDALKDQIKEDMEQKGVDEMKAGAFLIRWKMVLSNRFDTKAFQKEHESLYSQYVKQTSSRRFTIA